MQRVVPRVAVKGNGNNRHAVCVHKHRVSLWVVGTELGGSFARRRVVVDPQVARKLVQTGKPLCAARESTGMGLFARVGSDVARLVFETMERLVTHGALVWPIVALIFGHGDGKVWD